MLGRRTGDGEAFAAVFTPDGVFKSTRHNARGRAELVALGKSIAPPKPAGIQHWVTNMVIDGDAERAQVKFYFVAQRIDENGAVTTSSLGYYLDDVVKLDGRWLFAQRHFRRMATRERGIVPLRRLRLPASLSLLP